MRKISPEEFTNIMKERYLSQHVIDTERSVKYGIPQMSFDKWLIYQDTNKDEIELTDYELYELERNMYLDCWGNM